MLSTHFTDNPPSYEVYEREREKFPKKTEIEIENVVHFNIHIVLSHSELFTHLETSPLQMNGCKF